MLLGMKTIMIATIVIMALIATTGTTPTISMIATTIIMPSIVVAVVVKLPKLELKIMLLKLFKNWQTFKKCNNNGCMHGNT